MWYGGENKGLFVLLSRTQAGPGRTVKQEQEEISRNHVQTLIFPSVQCENATEIERKKRGGAERERGTSVSLRQARGSVTVKWREDRRGKIQDGDGGREGEG